ncbi:MAG: Lrp/AsnC family transcriptional regulator [Verrucomicrobiota bacterium]
MSSVLQLILEGERLDTAQMAQVLNLSEAEVEAELERLQAEKILLGWRPVLNPERAQEDVVRAVIEVRISPERDGGFDRLAARISRFDAVESCYLMSGSYDLLLFATGKDLREVASFVSERLASVGGVLSTATHFMLRAYKEQGHLLLSPTESGDKPAVSP